MASIFRNKKFDSWGIEVSIDGKRCRLYGFGRKREAEIVKEKVEELQAAQQIGGLSVDCKLWLNNLWKRNQELYNRLVAFGLAEPRTECGTLGELIDRYVSFPIDGRIPKIRSSKNRRTGANIIVNYLANQPLGGFSRNKDEVQRVLDMRADVVTKEVAGEIYAFMRKRYQAATWGRRIRHLKTMYGLAVRLKWIEENPFDGLRGASPANRSRDFFVDDSLAREVLSACPDARWRLIFSLARWGGLRIPSEITFLEWGDILWVLNRIRIRIPKKTSQEEQERGNFECRDLPIFPEIRLALEEYRASLPTTEPTGRIFPEMLNVEGIGQRLTKQLQTILREAGLPVWPKLFSNLRSTRDTELQREHPLHVVCAWLGHTPQISLQHYTQVTERDFEKAAQFPTPQTMRNTGRP
ncbi:MAG: site-specific integrase [Planctomycetia bacterium]|nr:site-specific integrase [Planctomycetia bacterium]